MAASDALGPQFRPIEGFDNKGFEAHVGGNRIGTIFVSPSKVGGLVVNNIDVDPEHRRKGVGSGLYRAASQGNGGVPIDHWASTMSPLAKKAVARQAKKEPGLHRKVVLDTNGNSRARKY